MSTGPGNPSRKMAHESPYAIGTVKNINGENGGPKSPHMAGEVQVEIAGFNQGGDPNKLAWARPVTPFMAQNQGIGIGPPCGSMQSTGTKVLVHFVDGDMQNPVYLGSITAGTDKDGNFGQPGQGDSPPPSKEKDVRLKDRDSYAWDTKSSIVYAVMESPSTPGKRPEAKDNRGFTLGGGDYEYA